MSDYDRTKSAVTEKLGGEFDYVDFMDELKAFSDEKSDIVSGFRNNKLQVPPAAPTNVPKYNFKTAAIKPKSQTQPIEPPVPNKLKENEYDSRDQSHGFTEFSKHNLKTNLSLDVEENVAVAAAVGSAPGQSRSTRNAQKSSSGSRSRSKKTQPQVFITHS